MSAVDTVPAELAELAAAVRALTDRAEITDLLDRYVGHLDRSRDTDDWLGSVFTEDAVVVFPMGTYRGTAGLLEFGQLARTTFARTQHLAANTRVQPVVGDGGVGDTARVGGHLVAVHLPDAQQPGEHFGIGGHYEAEVLRTAAGWRLRGFTFALAWHAGRPPSDKVRASELP